MKECVFCKQFIPNRKPLFENKLAIAYFDEFPVSKGHTLIITKRHAETFFDITDEEQIAIIELLNEFNCKKLVLFNHGETTRKEQIAKVAFENIKAKNIGILGNDVLFRVGPYGLIKTMTTKFC